MRAAMPLYSEPENPTFTPAVRQLGAALRHLRLDADFPRAASEEELRGFWGPVAVFASEGDVYFPSQVVLPRAREIFPNLALAEILESCRHVPSKEALALVNERILAFLAGPDETSSGRYRHSRSALRVARAWPGGSFSSPIPQQARTW